MTWLFTLLFAFAAGGLVWFFVGGVKVKPGWQNSRSLLARYLDGRRRTMFNLQLPEALATMSNALRAGFSLAQAFDSVAESGFMPISEEFLILQRQMRIGMSLEDALESMTERVGSEDLMLVTTAILVSRKSGGNVTEIFDRISETIRGRMKIERKVSSLTAQGRLQGIVVTAMPAFLGVILTIMRPKMMLPFLTSPMGVVLIVGVCVLMLFGWLLIRKIIHIDV